MKKMHVAFILIIQLMGCNKDDSNKDDSNIEPSVPSLIEQVSIIFSNQAGGKRSFYLSLPDNYSMDTEYKLALVFSGTSMTGFEMKKFFGNGWSGISGLEANMPNTIFVYPDPKWRHFPAWWRNGRYGGWLLGPYAEPAEGMEDIHFISELLDWVQYNYSIDSERVFATGHSWGGDMTAVIGCFLGDKLKAIAPVAANRPFWFESGNSTLNCLGNPSVWTFFGNDDEHFDGYEPNKGDFGREQNQFWVDKYACGTSFTKLNIIPSESIEYINCTSTVRFTLYSPSFSGNQSGHLPPDFYLSEVSIWFNSF